MSSIDFRTGALTGRLGGMVGAAWKGIDYVRKFVIPFNPKSTDQIGVRLVFANLVEMGRRINSTILKEYTLPKPKKMSAFNKFLSINQALIDSKVWTIGDVKASKGGLFQAPTWDIVAGTADDTVNVSWDDDLEGEALATDKVIIILYNADKDLYAFETSKARSDAAAAITILETAGDVIHGWMFVTQGDTLASDSSYATDTVS